jgi:hypothetical protein
MHVCKWVGDRIFIQLLYIDDILAIVNEREAKRLKEWQAAKCGSVQFKENGRLSSLGMDVEITNEGT